MRRRTLAVAGRVLRQLRNDRKFLAWSLLVPVLIIYVTRAALDAFDIPFFDVSRFALPLAAFIVHFITYILCAIVLVRERGAQTLDRMFVNGYRQAEIIGGYTLAYTVLATAQSVIVLGEFAWLFHLRYPASTIAAAYLVIWMLAVISIALGILASNFARTEGQVLPFIPLVTVPGIFLSGVVIAVERLPGWARMLSRATPLYYANGIIEKLTASNEIEWWRVGTLALYGLVVLLLATRTLREAE